MKQRKGKNQKLRIMLLSNLFIPTMISFLTFGHIVAVTAAVLKETGKSGELGDGMNGRRQNLVVSKKKASWVGGGGESWKATLADAKAKVSSADNKPVGKKNRTKQKRHLTDHARKMLESQVDMNDVDLGDATPEAAARIVLERIGASIEDRMSNMFEKATSSECRALIGEHFGHFVNAIGKEVSMPFGEEQFYSECEEEKYDFDNLPEGISIGHVQNRTYQPPRNETEYLDDPDDLRLLYAILTHDDANSTIRLIEALYEPGHLFIVHVDGKEKSDLVHDAIKSYSTDRDYVHVLDHPHRVRVNWGGFSMVNATMQTLRYAFGLDGSSNLAGPLTFHRFVHMAATSYPIASNTEIRRRLASYPLDANMVHVVFKPTRPAPSAWNYFVECDDALQRIYRLTPLAEDNYGIDVYTSSQWFIISREFAEYIAAAKPGTLVRDFLDYVTHAVVADESFFGTVLRHSSFCTKHHNDNFLHLQFDRWENELGSDVRDERKCVMPDPDHCGRSPTTMTLDYLPALELSGSLFARKFISSIDSQIKDVLDIRRAKEETLLRNGTDSNEAQHGPDTSFEGHGVLIVASETMNETTPLCLGLGESQNKVRLIPCFHDWVPQTLAPGWETGAVVEDEILRHNRWDLGPCSSDGNLERKENGELEMTPGRFSQAGPSCLIKQKDGLRAGRCLDSESDRLQPGGSMHVYPCVQRWNQFFAFGNGTLAPSGSIHTTVPKHIKQRIESRGRSQESFLCLGVSGRGNITEEPWEEDKGKETGDVQPELLNITDTSGLLPLHHWTRKQLVTTPCSNTDAVLTWRYIPFIVEDDDQNAEVESSSEDKNNTSEVEEEL